jgi:SsrA-binding protein
MRIFHRKASFEYDFLDRLEAGVKLTGAEVKSLAAGHASLEGAFVKIIGNEAYLVNAQIAPYAFARPEQNDPKRTRKLLLHKKEIISVKSRIEGANLTLIPVAWYNKGPKFKLEVGVARGKKQYEKREKKQREDQKRELDREFRGKVK